MPERFASAEALFDAVRGLIDRLESSGQAAAAVELRSGFACLNGLTDGWAGLLAAIEQVRATHGRQLAATDRHDLDCLRAEVLRIVGRR